MTPNSGFTIQALKCGGGSLGTLKENVGRARKIMVHPSAEWVHAGPPPPRIPIEAFQTPQQKNQAAHRWIMIPPGAVRQ